MTELLAPAGDIERLKIAFLYGADAVYIGGKDFSLRANAKNFSLDEIKEATVFAHSLNKKLYVTVNIVFHNEDLVGLDRYLTYLDKIKVDGIIVSDITVIKRVKELKLNLFIILSTQASVLNHYSAEFYKNLGVKRIVLAREASKSDIAMIISKTNIEVETFIHGAMCTSISGRCVLSNFATNRDANRGGCAQVCRWTFKSDYEDDFTFMSKDLNMLKHLKEMIDLNVVSFKVEGRMRSIYYIASVINTYRKAIDKALKNDLTNKDILKYERILNRVSNRESKDQFFETKTTYKDQYYSDRVEETNKDFLGLVLGYDEEKKLLHIEERNYFKLGDEVEFFTPSGEEFKVKIKELKNKNFEDIKVANHPQMEVYIPFKHALEKYSMMRKIIIDKD